MNTNTAFDDEFDSGTGAQPSGYINVAEAPALSQSAWYDLEDYEEEYKDDRGKEKVARQKVKVEEEEREDFAEEDEGFFEEEDEDQDVSDDNDDDNDDDDDDDDDELTNILPQRGQRGGVQNVSKQRLAAARQWQYRGRAQATSTPPLLSRRSIMLTAASLAVVAAMLGGLLFLKSLPAHSAAPQNPQLTQKTAQAPTVATTRPTPVPKPSPTSPAIAATGPTQSSTQIMQPLQPSQPTQPTQTTQPSQTTQTGQPAQTAPSTQQLTMPAGWTASGHNIVDVAEALDVASTFVQRYNTIDARSQGTLDAARFILTDGANQRFVQNDKHHSTAFTTQIQQEQLMQAAAINSARLIKAQQLQNGEFFAWASVTYQITTQQGDGPAATMNNQTMTVLLFQVPFNTPAGNAPMGGIGWLVSDYASGNTLPPIPGTL